MKACRVLVPVVEKGSGGRSCVVERYKKTLSARQVLHRTSSSSRVVCQGTAQYKEGEEYSREEQQGQNTTEEQEGGDRTQGQSDHQKILLSMESDIKEVYENQRWFGFSWSPPLAVLDCPAWSALDGTQVAGMPQEGWHVVVNNSTDAEGWQYATVFKHLEYKRAGGRASQRFGDTVRRRLWRRDDLMGRDREVHPQKKGGAQDSVFRAKYESESKAKAYRAFIAILSDLLSRRKVWDLVPWDPSAFFVLQRQHKSEYDALREKAKDARIFGADRDPPKSILHEEGTLLQDLICSAVHSRAAYGFAMQAGHISSVSSYIKLHTVQPLRFDAVGGVSQEANNEAIAALTGVQLEDIFVSNWKNSPFRPCHYVAADRANKCIVVSIRGSLELGDLLSDVTAHPLEVDLMGTDGWVHQGIMAAATYIHCCTKDALEEAAQKFPGWPLLVTGHSLGGGVAAILTMLLNQSGGIDGLGKIRCITIGPAAVMSAPLAHACDDIAISVILGSDPVPHLSYASVENLLLDMSKSSPVKKAAEDIGKRISKLIGITKEPETVQHDMHSNREQYVWRPVETASRSNQATEGLGGVIAADFSGEKRKSHRDGGQQLDIIELKDTDNVRSHPICDQDAESRAARMLRIVEYIPESDATLISSAQAQENCNVNNVEGSINSDSRTTESHQKPGNPETLFPPGKLLWILCEENSVNSQIDTHDSYDESVVDPDSVESLWETGWVGETQQEEGITAAKSRHGTSSECRMNDKKSNSIVVIAERDAFERLFILPSMLEDHLPDRYLEALQDL